MATTLALELLYAALLFFVTRFIIVRQVLSKGTQALPPGPRGWPFIGALPLLGSMPHVALANLSIKYGPIMYLKMGTCGMVVASTPDVARECLKTVDLNFSNRPSNAGATYLAYDSQDMVFADYGPRWKLLRKLSNLHMLGGKALDAWAHVRRAEVGHMLEAMMASSLQGEPVVISEMLTYAMANMLGQVILSQRVFVTKGTESNEFKDMVVELMTTAGLFNIGDFIPSVAWMDLQGIQGGMKRLHNKFDVLLTEMIEKHSQTKHRRLGKPDFLDALMDYTNSVTVSVDEKLTDINIKALLLNLFTAGTDTSSSVIEWALAEIMMNPKILARAHFEMDQVIGRARRLEESDIQNLPYLQAICKETFRKHPSTPLNLPRVSSQACQISGYFIPKGTRLSVNIWAIGRDPNVWENPLEFNPERFLSGENSKIDPRGNNFELIPFGAGRRMCAGARMGIVMVEYILGTLLHSFDWKVKDGVEMNMEETFGLALQKAVPLSALVIPRLVPEVYKNLFTAGTDTSSSVIEWALADMMMDPKILVHAHFEMDQVIGRVRRLEESDIQNLPYLQAILQGNFQKTPLNLPRVSSQACQISGYYIPKGTRLSVNIWPIRRDPNVWENPLEFNPERFLSGENSKIDSRRNSIELIPFGAGRRICAGARMRIVMVEYILGTLLHSFGVEMNMEETFRLALQKAVPLSALVIPRLAPEAYKV